MTYFYKLDMYEEDSFGGRYTCRFSPYSDSNLMVFNGMQWDEQKKFFQSWLDNLKGELEVDLNDIWSDFNDKIDIFKIKEQFDNEPFTEDEIRQLEIKLSSIQDKIKENTSISESEKNFLINSFDYFKGAAKRVGKLDWLNIVVGQTLRFALTEETLRFVGNLLLYLFKNLLSS